MRKAPLPRRHVAASVLCIVMLLARSGQASPIPFESWLNGQNALLVEIAARHADEVAKLSAMLAQARLIVSNTNDALAIARVAKRAVDLITHYDLDQLRRDAMLGLDRAFPELRDLENEVDLLVRNGQAIAANDGSFFRRVDYHDSRAQRLAVYAYQSTIWPLAFPRSMKRNQDPTPVDMLVQNRYMATQTDVMRAYQNAAVGELIRKSGMLWNDAEKKDNLQVRAEALSAHTNVQMMRDTTEMLNMKQQEVAIEEAERMDTLAVRGAMMKLVIDHPEILTGAKVL